MQKYLLGGIAGLILGLTIGFFAANAINRNASLQPSAANTATIAANGQTTTGAVIPDVAEAIAKANSEPQNLEAQLKVADMYWKINKFDMAAEFYQRAVEIKPADFALNIKLANAYFEGRQFENAEKYYSKALEIDPANIDARTDLGTTFVERQTPDLDRAMQEFEKVLAIDPKHQPTLYNMAVIYSKKGDTGNVGKMLARLEAIDPSSRYVTRLRQMNQPK
jgi:tetratricopeptide (TPR) repeat protein